MPRNAHEKLKEYIKGNKEKAIIIFLWRGASLKNTNPINIIIINDINESKSLADEMLFIISAILLLFFDTAVSPKGDNPVSAIEIKYPTKVSPKANSPNIEVPNLSIR